MDFQRRFGGIARLYGDVGLQKLMDAHVCLIGVGGVGSWAAEALARSAVGNLTLIDMDIVVESNINRQLHSLGGTLGRDKTDVMSERIRAINDAVRVQVVDEFVTLENIAELLTPEIDYVIDCIDNYRVKAALVNHCKQGCIPVVTVGGTGGQVDPTKIRVADLSRTEHDPLISSTRKLLRQEYGFSRDVKQRFDVPCVYSGEQTRYPTPGGGISMTRPDGMDGGDLTCSGGLGSVSTVTASFGFVAASHVLGQIAR
jgi:tRNA A37 threonylcarbamoyladenosine dehydratase